MKKRDPATAGTLVGAGTAFGDCRGVSRIDED
jgi:hypothetical protein